MFCYRCGKQQSDDAARCTECGAILTPNANNAGNSPELGTNGDSPRPVSISLWQYFARAIESKMFCLKGRARRKEYWSVVLFLSLAFMLFMVTVTVLGAIAPECLRYIKYVPYGVTILCTLATFSLTVRRAHDINWPAIVPILLIVCNWGFTIAQGLSNEPVVTETANGSTTWTVHYSVVTDNSLPQLIIMIVWLFILFKRGTKGENKYGPDPIYFDEPELPPHN